MSARKTAPSPERSDVPAHAAARGAKDAQAALDSGDYGYHKTTRGLSTRTLLEDFWSFAEAPVCGDRVDAQTKRGARAAYQKAWREVIHAAEHPPKPTGWSVDADGRLDLSDLGRIPSGIRGDRRVRSLSLYGMGLKKLDAVLFTLSEVEEVYLSRNKLVEVPTSLVRWPALKVLHLGENPIVNADAVCKLRSLKALDLSVNKLRELPADIGALEQLEVLDLFQPNAAWTELPPSFAKLKRLKVVRAPLNRVAAVAKFVRAAKLKTNVVKTGAVMP